MNENRNGFLEMDGGKGEVLNDIIQRGRKDALWRNRHILSTT